MIFYSHFSLARLLLTGHDLLALFCQLSVIILIKLGKYKLIMNSSNSNHTTTPPRQRSIHHGDAAAFVHHKQPPQHDSDSTFGRSSSSSQRQQGIAARLKVSLMLMPLGISIIAFSAVTLFLNTKAHSESLRYTINAHQLRNFDRPSSTKAAGNIGGDDDDPDGSEDTALKLRLDELRLDMKNRHNAMKAELNQLRLEMQIEFKAEQSGLREHVRQQDRIIDALIPVLEASSKNENENNSGNDDTRKRRVGSGDSTLKENIQQRTTLSGSNTTGDNTTQEQQPGTVSIQQSSLKDEGSNQRGKLKPEVPNSSSLVGDNESRGSKEEAKQMSEETLSNQTHKNRSNKKLVSESPASSFYLEQMIKKNLTMSVKQQRKFFNVQHKILDWVRSNKDRKHLLYPSRNKRFFGFILNNDFAYVHIFKNGGSSVEAQTKTSHVTPARSGNRTLIATVRDPISHFLSGWSECGKRLPDMMLQGIANQTYDERVSDWLSIVQELQRGEYRIEGQGSNCPVHSYPQANFLLQTNSNQYEIYSQLQILGDTREIPGMFSLAGMEYNASLSPMNVASRDKIKSTHFPKMVDELSDETVSKLCQFLALDYYLFDFDPPVVCRSLAFWTDYSKLSLSK